MSAGTLQGVGERQHASTAFRLPGVRPRYPKQRISPRPRPMWTSAHSGRSSLSPNACLSAPPSDQLLTPARNTGQAGHYLGHISNRRMILRSGACPFGWPGLSDWCITTPASGSMVFRPRSPEELACVLSYTHKNPLLCQSPGRPVRLRDWCRFPPKPERAFFPGERHLQHRLRNGEVHRSAQRGVRVSVAKPDDVRMRPPTGGRRIPRAGRGIPRG